MNPWTDSPGFAQQAAKCESAGETILLAMLWWRRSGWTVRAQEPLEEFRIDLFIPEAKVAIEVDSFGGHGSAKDMERDARKRNLAVARGFAPLSYSAQQAVFHPHDALADILANVSRRMPAKRPGPARTRPPEPADGGPILTKAELAAKCREFVASAEARAKETATAPVVHLSASQRAFANRGEAECDGVELLGVVLDCPALIHDEQISEMLRNTDGPVSLAAVALGASVSSGNLDRAAFLRDCPALLQPIALRRLATPVCASAAAAAAQAENIIQGIRARGAGAMLQSLAMDLPAEPPKKTMRRRR